MNSQEQQQQQQQQQHAKQVEETAPLRRYYGASESFQEQTPTSTTRHNNNKTTSTSTPHHSLLGISLIMLGSFCFSCMFLFVKLMQGTANSFTLVFYRAWVEIPIALYLIWREGEHPLGRDVAIRPWLLVRGGMGAAAVLCFFYAIQHLPLPDAVTLQFTTPPFAAAFAVVLAGEKWLKLDMMGAVVCFMGVMLIAHPSWLFGNPNTTTTTTTVNGHNPSSSTSNTGAGADDDSATFLAIAVALLGAALAGLAYMSVRKIGHRATANVMVLYYGAFSIPLVLLGSKCLRDQWNVWSEGAALLSAADWGLLVLTGLSAYAGQYLVNLGLQHETAATGTLATCTQIVWTYVFELAVLHEALNAWSMAGTVLILGFMVTVGIVKMQRADETVHETVAGEPEEIALLFAAEHDVRHTRTNEPADDPRRGAVECA